MSPEEQHAVYEQMWEQGGFRFLASAFTDLLLDKRANDVAADFVRNKIRQIVKDPETAELLCPFDHPYGTKRQRDERDLQLSPDHLLELDGALRAMSGNPHKEVHADFIISP